MKEQEIKTIDDNGKLTAAMHDGSRIYPLDTISAPKPWVVDGKKGDEFWSNVNNFAIPLKIKWGILPSNRRERGYLENRKQIYGDDIFMVLIPDTETFGGWSARLIIPSDLQKQPNELFNESLDAMSDGNIELSEMKRHTAMILLGWTDTK